MGRPYLGVRKQVNVRMYPDLVAKIDAARGPQTRDAWISAACETALGPIARYSNPTLDNPVHEHIAALPLRTEFTNGERIRVYACTCGKEMSKC